MKRRLIIAFLITETALYITFMAADLAGAGAVSTAIKYSGIIGCLLFAAVSTYHGGHRLILPALLLTASADFFLLVLDKYYMIGVTIFFAVQMIYMARLRIMAGKMFLPLRIAMIFISFIILFLINMLNPLNFLSVAYFSQLLVNAVIAWTSSGKRMRIFACGLTLFAMCDTCVGLFNMLDASYGSIYAFCSFGMWLFYLPSQVLIVLSGLPHLPVPEDSVSGS